MTADFYIPPHPLLQPFVNTLLATTSHQEKLGSRAETITRHSTTPELKNKFFSERAQVKVTPMDKGIVTGKKSQEITAKCACPGIL